MKFFGFFIRMNLIGWLGFMFLMICDIVSIVGGVLWLGGVYFFFLRKVFVFDILSNEEVDGDKRIIGFGCLVGF